MNGLRLAGAHFGHLYYLRDLAEGRDRFLAAVLCAAVGRGGVAVDAGAYIGYLTVELARAVGPAGRVYAIEPDPAAAAALRANLRRNHVEDRADVIQQAVAATPGRAVLHLSGSGQTNSLAAVAGSHGSIDVAVTTIDDVLARETRVDVAKVDVEGAELLALGGMQETLRRQRDLALVVECNRRCSRACAAPPASCSPGSRRRASRSGRSTSARRVSRRQSSLAWAAT